MGLLRGKMEGMGFVGLPERGWVLFLPGVVAGLYGVVGGLTSFGDDVVTMTPIYPPFLSAIGDQGRRVRAAKLVQGVGRWEVDWEAMEGAVTPASRLLMLCHPHNPTGRVWTGEELRKIGAFAERHRLWVVSDELHADLCLDGDGGGVCAVCVCCVGGDADAIGVADGTVQGVQHGGGGDWGDGESQCGVAVADQEGGGRVDGACGDVERDDVAGGVAG